MSLIEYHLDDTQSLASSFRSSRQGSVATSHASSYISRGQNSDTFKFNVVASNSGDVTLLLTSLANLGIRNIAEVKLNL